MKHPIRFDQVEGQGRDKSVLRYWSDRASRNSDSYAHRARAGGRIDLASTGPVDLHSTSAPPRHDAAVDENMIADDNYSSDLLD